MNSFTNPTAQVIVAIIPIVGIVFGGVIIFFYLLWKHRETSLLIRSGSYSPVTFNVPLFSLLAGLLLTATGLVLSVLFLFMDGFSYTLLGGLIPLAVGIALLVFYRISKPRNG